FPNNAALREVVHEFGHLLGVDHVYGLDCRDALGNRVAISDNCINVVYQDCYDAMGNSCTYQMNAIHKNFLGWLPPSATQTITKPGDYAVAPLEQSTGVRLLEVVPSGNPNQWRYYIESRQRIGLVDNFEPSNVWAPNGVLIHRSYSASYPTTYLIDTTPGSNQPSGSWVYDIPLTVGKTFTD